jgi:SlyX protein
MSDSGTSTDRLEELESRLAFQDELVERLNEVVVRQDRLIADLQLRLSNLEKRTADLAESATAAGEGAGHEAPPHY